MQKGLRIIALAFIIGTSVVIFFALRVINPPSIIDTSPGSRLDPGPAFETTEEVIDMKTDDRLTVVAHALVGGGPPKDGIPPIDEPKYISVDEVGDFLDGEDPVFVLVTGEDVKVFPQKILVWHEIVNAQVGTEDVAITYCPLTGTVLGFPHEQEGATSSLGTSGKLVNSNLVMYDRETDSYFPQVLRAAVKGERFGEELTVFPVDWSTWSTVKEAYPNAQVLSKQTGFLRTYGDDPYGSYLEEGTYYDSGNAFFPLLNKDDRLPQKEVVVAIYGPNGAHAAIKKSSVSTQNPKTIELGGQMFTAVYDEILQTVKVYEGKNGDGELADYLDSMWFAWAAYFPDTELYE